METRNKFRERWLDRVSPLPSQVSRQHLSAISICSTIGSGLFIAALSNSLKMAGPAGVLIAYITTSTIVYATCISNAEMVGFMPNAGGPVGLADVFVDPALGFALGWGAYYHWSIMIPAQLAIAAKLVKSYVALEVTTRATIVYYVSAGIFLAVVVALNCLSAKRFGAIHAAFAVLKLISLAVLIFSVVVIDWAGVPLCNTWPPPEACNVPGSAETFAQLHIGGLYWRHPRGPFAEHPFDIGGRRRGSIMGIFTALIQSLFAFNGTEVGSIIGREVIDASRNTRIVVRRVWLRVTVVYLLAVVAVGLVVPYDHPNLGGTPSIMMSPWTIAFATATRSPAPRYLLTIIFVLSALSASSAEIWIASRWLFFLARRGHAPLTLGSLYKGGRRYPALPVAEAQPRPDVVRKPSENLPQPAIEMNTLGLGLTGLPPLEPIIESYVTPATPTTSEADLGESYGSPSTPESARRLLPSHHRLPSTAPSSISWSVPGHTAEASNGSSSKPVTPRSVRTTALPQPTPIMRSGAGPSRSTNSPTVSGAAPAPAPASRRQPKRTEATARAPPPTRVIPWVGVVFGGAIGLLVFMAPAGQTDSGVSLTFSFLAGMTNCASLVGWIGMLITYLRFYIWISIQEKKNTNFKTENRDSLYKNRARGQPWVAIYGLLWCIVLLLGQGWSVFTLPDANQVAQLEPNENPPKDPDMGDFAYNFCVAYLPVALFLLLYFGYKLVYQTNVVKLEQKKFRVRVRIPEPENEPPSRTVWERICKILL
ncbi:amino acid permease-domain-containing protein [Auriculariales sp. MPI-PUGE-AT-0066]|nr:amino acid permease-domain-containing protein [Auriculariales sp. MPI-PUGE-AT-0066]